MELARHDNLPFSITALTAQLTRRTETALLMSVPTSEWTRYYAAQAVTLDGGGRSVPSLKR